MLPGRQPELTIKFTEKPEIPAEGKKVLIDVKSENGIIVSAELNRKTIAKQIKKIEEYEEWIGALSGKISHIHVDGRLLLEGAGVQIFEKKKK